MKKIFFLVIVLMLGLASAAFAIDLNPAHWVSAGGYGLAVMIAGYLLKVKLDRDKLKTALTDIKLAVDEVRKSNDANSPGGNRVVVGEAKAIAAQSLTAILSTLRALPEGWIPHWVKD